MSHYTRGFFPPNPNKSTDGKNADDVKLEEEIGVEVIGRLQWEKYITTSPKAMAPGDKPTPATVSKNVSAARPSREGWVFQHVTRTAERWAMEVWPCPPHRRNSRVTLRRVARSYFRSISPQLDPILGHKEQGPEGQGCLKEAEPEQQSLTIILARGEAAKKVGKDEI